MALEGKSLFLKWAFVLFLDQLVKLLVTFRGRPASLLSLLEAALPVLIDLVQLGYGAPVP